MAARATRTEGQREGSRIIMVDQAEMRQTGVEQPGASVETRSMRRRMLHAFLLIAGVYLIAAYLVIPFGWERYAHRHPSFDDNPRLTTTGDDHPGDPLNVALIGTKEQVEAIMAVAKWDPAAALGIRSDLKIAEDT